MAINTFATLKTAVANWLENDGLSSRIPEFISLAEDRIANTADLRIRAMEQSTDLIIEQRVGVLADEVAGTANAITFTPATAHTANVTGDRWRFTAEATNTSTVTLNISALGAVAIKKYLEGSIQELEVGDIVNGHVVDLFYDGTQYIKVPRGGVPLPSNFLAQRRLFVYGTPNTALRFLAPMNFWSKFLSQEVNPPIAYTIESDHIILGPDSNSALSLRMLYYRRFATLSADADTNWILTNARGLLLYASLIEANVYLEDDEGALKFATLYDDTVRNIMEADKFDRHSGAPLEAVTEINSDRPLPGIRG